MTPILESERLHFKPISEEHLTVHYVNWMNDINVYQYLSTGGDCTIEKLKNYLKHIAENPQILFWAIHLRENNKHIGNIKIEPVSVKHGLAHYGIVMGDRTEWGKGYAKEASLRILKYCFDELALRKVTLGVVVENITAVELYKKIGFEIEGLFKKQGYYNNHYCDTLSMAIFNPDFKY